MNRFHKSLFISLIPTVIIAFVNYYIIFIDKVKIEMTSLLILDVILHVSLYVLVISLYKLYKNNITSSNNSY